MVDFAKLQTEMERKRNRTPEQVAAEEAEEFEAMKATVYKEIAKIGNPTLTVKKQTQHHIELEAFLLGPQTQLSFEVTAHRMTSGKGDASLNFKEVVISRRPPQGEPPPLPYITKNIVSENRETHVETRIPNPEFERNRLHFPDAERNPEWIRGGRDKQKTPINYALFQLSKEVLGGKTLEEFNPILKSVGEDLRIAIKTDGKPLSKLNIPFSKKDEFKARYPENLIWKSQDRSWFFAGQVPKELEAFLDKPKEKEPEMGS